MVCWNYFIAVFLIISCYEIRKVKVQICRGTERNGLKMVDCSNKNIYLVPASSTNNVQFLDLSSNSRLHFSPDSFETYVSSLIRLKISHVDNINVQRSASLAPLDLFHELKNLQILEFTNSHLTDEDMWQLPPNLLKYNVDGNEYTYLNVSMCPKLEELSANDNKLTRMPILSDPPPAIKVLLIKNNLLDDFTVRDIAPLCDLKKLELKLPSNAFLNYPSGSCRCMQLEAWVEVFGISGTVLNCDPSDVMTCDLTLIEFKELRQGCSDAYLLPIQSRSWGKMILGAIIGLFILSSLSFIIYKYIDRITLPGEDVLKQMTENMKAEAEESVVQEEGSE